MTIPGRQIHYLWPRPDGYSYLMIGQLRSHETNGRRVSDNNNISQLLRDSLSVSQQPPIWDTPSHYSMSSMFWSSNWDQTETEARQKRTALIYISLIFLFCKRSEETLYFFPFLYTVLGFLVDLEIMATMARFEVVRGGLLTQPQCSQWGRTQPAATH